MKLLNATRMKAAYTMGMKPDGQELLVAVVKGTFNFPRENGETLRLSPEQMDLVMSDEFSGKPGFSAPVRESDFSPFKSRCDVVLNGCAHAPGGKRATRVQVGLRIGSLTKSFEVVGNRSWKAGLLGVGATEIEPFLQMPISYDRAFGGSDNSHPDVRKHAATMGNPVGVGFHVNHAPSAIDGKPLPHTEETGKPVTKPDGSYRPMSFGVLGRGWEPRIRYAGTYDQNWTDNVFPFLPADFDDRYYQSAPEDQQIDFPTGGEDVVLVNLTVEGRTTFKLPGMALPVSFYMKNFDEHPRKASADTIIIDSERRQVFILWRAAIPLKRSMHEVAQVVVGTMPRAWHRAREMGKTWYPSLKELVNDRRAGR